MAFHRIGFALTGSFCTHRDALAVMEELAGEYEIVPILSEHAGSWDTRFGTAEDLRRRVAKIAGREPVTTVAEAERFGPADPLDALILCPCTGNTLATLARGITDTTVTMAFDCGIRNISAGAVLAVAYLPAEALLPVMIGTLFQQLLAAIVGKTLQRRNEREPLFHRDPAEPEERVVRANAPGRSGEKAPFAGGGFFKGPGSPRDGGARDADEAPVSVSGLRADEKARVLIRKRAAGETRAVQDGS